MKTIRSIKHSPQGRKRAADPPAPPPRRRADSVSTPSDIKLLLVDFRSGEAVRRHPDLKPWLEADWRIRSAVPRVVERGQTKLLVVLERPVPERNVPGRSARMRPVQL